MTKGKKLPFKTVALGRKFYLKEVKVEEKSTQLLDNFIIQLLTNWGDRDYTSDALKIIENGCCITLLSDSVPIKAKFFFDDMYFERYVKFVFWTFDEAFFRKLSHSVKFVNKALLKRYIDLLNKYPKAYTQSLDTGENDEVTYSFRKHALMISDKKLAVMFELDAKNRENLLKLINDQFLELSINEGETGSIEDSPGFKIDNSINEQIILTADTVKNKFQLAPSLLEAPFGSNVIQNANDELEPTNHIDNKNKAVERDTLISQITNNDPQSTLIIPTFLEMLGNFPSSDVAGVKLKNENKTDEQIAFILIIRQLEIFPPKFDLFVPAPKDKKGHNRRFFNGYVGAMITLIYTLGYIKNEIRQQYDNEELKIKEALLDAYFKYSNNSIPKYRGNFTFFYGMHTYNDLIKKIKPIKNNKLRPN